MRFCQKCKAPDRAEVNPESDCKCGAVDRGDEDHKSDCPRLIHEVTQYFVRADRSELNIEKKDLTPYYKQQGWQMFRNGERFYRWMMLCRSCIRANEEALTRKKDYQKACRTAQGIEDQTYAQMLASQGS